MAENLNGQYAHPEQPAAARENSLLMDGATFRPGSSGFQSSSKPSRRVCLRPDCTRVLGSFLQDPHSVCVHCRDICNPAVPSSSDPDLIQFSVLPPQSPDAKRMTLGGSRSPAPTQWAPFLGTGRWGNWGEVGWRGRLGPPSVALGEGLAGKDSCPLALSPQPLDGMLMPYPQTASSVRSANRGPLSDDPPTSQQTHCPARTSLHSGHVASVSADVAPPQHDLTRSDSRRLGGDLFLADAYDWVSCLALLALLVLGGRIQGPHRLWGPNGACCDSERHDGLPTGLEGDEGREFPPHGPSM
ncbi:hypothetical protein E2C01_052541 [Portunus trituberculatus]|uniref:Uncharacterized protein n=1 Tax=Portunus trituberculatus TaxID=210409 RepID=A0A5B7GM49_PORTR|nr:hypothetical protein [Portunus trituberculatus]